jgi:hypothetical protein
MPVARYFLFVGGVLLALLFAIDAFVPREPAVASNSAPSIDRPTVRIHSDQKLPERVVYDTSLPTIVPPTATVQAAAAPPAALSAQARVHNTFAQFVPESKQALSAESTQSSAGDPRKLEPQAPKKRKVAKSHASPQYGPPMHFAQQQPRFGFFGAPIWNNTW